jgi:thiol-disulfide isomerase/thioredoxin
MKFSINNYFFLKSSVLIIFCSLFSIQTLNGDNSTAFVGEKAPHISLLKIADNKYFRTKKVLGEKNIVISFFGTWCGPCRKEIPKLQEIYEDVDTEEFEFLLICVSNIIPTGSSKAFKEKIPDIKKFIKSVGTDIPVLIDKYALVWKKFANMQKPEFPLTVVIDKDGKISYHHHGYSNGDEIKLKKHLDTL